MTAESEGSGGTDFSQGAQEKPLTPPVSGETLEERTAV